MSVEPEQAEHLNKVDLLAKKLDQLTDEWEDREGIDSKHYEQQQQRRTRLKTRDTEKDFQ